MKRWLPMLLIGVAALFGLRGGVSAVLAGEVAGMVHDIPSNHPRIPYFARLADAVAQASRGTLGLAVNPGGVVYPGRASLDAVRDGRVQIAWVNSSHLEGWTPGWGRSICPFP